MADGIWQDGGLAPLHPGEGVQVDGFIARGADNSVWISGEGTTGTDPTLTGAGPITDNDFDWTRIPDWPTSTAVAAGNRRQATTPDGHLRTAQNDFTTDSTEPTWVTDGTTNIDGVAAPSGGGYGDNALEVTMYFDVWRRNDRQGDSIGTLTQHRDAFAMGIDNAMGNGHFTINRHDDEFDDLCWPPRNLVRVRVDPDGPFAYDDPRYKVAFFMETYEDVILDGQEEGAENVKIAGSGGETILKEAVIDWEAHHPFNQLSGREFDRTVAKDGQWHINASEFDAAYIGTPGSVMRAFLRDAASQSPSPIPECNTYPTGHDFNVQHDSLGVEWSDGATDWTFDVGMTLYDVLQTLVNGGLYYQMLPSLMLRAFENRQGVDRSDSITFSDGQPDGVSEAGTRQVEAMQVVSRVLMRGPLVAERRTWRWATESGSNLHHDSLAGGDIEADIGVKQSSIEYAASGTPSRLSKAGRVFVTRSRDQHEGPPTIGVLNSTGKVAFVDYYPGDTVGLNMPEFNDPTRIHSIAMTQRDSNGSVDVILEFLENPGVNYSSSLGTIAPVSNVEGGAERGLTTSPQDVTVTIAEDELLLLWWFPGSGALLVNGSPPDQINDSGMGFQQGPGTYVISMADSDSQYQYVIVSGVGRTVSGG